MQIIPLVEYLSYSNFLFPTSYLALRARMIDWLEEAGTRRTSLNCEQDYRQNFPIDHPQPGAAFANRAFDQMPLCNYQRQYLDGRSTSSPTKVHRYCRTEPSLILIRDSI